jgi:hypothetical protein
MLFPGFVTAVMEGARQIRDGPEIYLPFIAAVFALLASAPVICCFLWARSIGNSNRHRRIKF